MAGKSLADDPRLSLIVGGRPVGAHLQAAIDSGQVVEHPDGTLSRQTPHELQPDMPGDSAYLYHEGDFCSPCQKLNVFLFQVAYSKSAVPFGCRNCFKVKVVSRSLRQLMAVRDVAVALPRSSKSGMEGNMQQTPHIYATYVYNTGLEQARQTYKTLRSAVDANPKLGPDVQIFIKRGCTNYEHHCGPSDRYTFDPGLEDVESYLLPRIRQSPPKPGIDRAVAERFLVFKFVQMAYGLGDETYKDFTGEKDLYPAVVQYPPDGDPPPHLDVGARDESS